MGSRGEAPGHQLELGIVATINTLKLGIVVPKRVIIIDKFIRMGGQKVCLGDMAPIPPPGSATGDKPNATKFIKPQLEFLIIKLCDFESVVGGNCPPLPPVATPLSSGHRLLYNTDGKAAEKRIKKRDQFSISL